MTDRAGSFEGVGSPDEVRGRSSGSSGMSGSGVRVFGIGNEGRGAVGGANGGRDGRCIVEVMVAVGMAPCAQCLAAQPSAAVRVQLQLFSGRQRIGRLSRTTFAIVTVCWFLSRVNSQASDTLGRGEVCLPPGIAGRV